MMILLVWILGQAQNDGDRNTIDRLITLHQRELEKLQNVKKSLLEKMFV